MSGIAAISREILEGAWSGGPFDEGPYAPDYVFVGPLVPDGVHGAEGERELIAGYRRSFPDLTFAVEEQIVDGDRVVSRWTASGTHEGEFAGIAPTGRRGVVGGVSIARFAGDRLTNVWTMWDVHGLLDQLGRS